MSNETNMSRRDTHELEMKKHENDARQNQKVDLPDGPGLCPLIKARSYRRHFNVWHDESVAV